MNDRLHPALAEHAMERENERLRGLLAQLSKAPQAGEVMTRERLAAICEVGHDRSAFVAALSQQAEPVEPASAQDERAIDTAPLLRFIFSEYGSPEMAGCLPDDVLRVVRALEEGARPAQTEQQPVEVMQFQMKHPTSGESHTMGFTWKEVADGLEDRLFDKLVATICECEPIGETNVVECRCDEYAEEFELLAAAPIAQTEQIPKRDREVDRARFPDPTFNKWLDEVISDAGHTVWDQVNVYDAWAGWENRQWYAAPQHSDDEAVARFADAMKAKLAKARAKGRGGWENKDLVGDDRLAEMLVEHLRKGNAGTFEDVANFAMMLHQRGADPMVLAKAAQTEQPEQSGLVTEAMRAAAIAEYDRHDGDFADFARSVIRAALSGSRE